MTRTGHREPEQKHHSTEENTELISGKPNISLASTNKRLPRGKQKSNETKEPMGF